ncbi:MAG: prolyl oligopeptidase family serine peptidase [Proteobacteria bacterium]|nr:prolyl oligopeptidase family serine peptidase [Pseudomonadota bacterium]
MLKRSVLAAVCILVAGGAAAQSRSSAQPVQTREVGQLVLENIPVTPPEVREGIRRYQNARSAAFQDWLADGSMLITTRFGQTAQLHRVAAPGAARSQLTFFDEPIAGAVAQPRTDRYVYSRDTGGDEYFQAYLASTRGGPEARITEPGTRNQSVIFSDDGRRLAWARVSRGDPNYDIVVMDAADPASRRVVHEGQGAISPLDISPDGRTLLLGRYRSITDSELFLLDLASGRLTEINPRPEEVAYGGGEFTPDGRSVVTLSDQGSDVQRLVQLDLATGRPAPISATDLRWNVESFDLSDDGRRLAYAINEDGWSRIVVQDFRTRRALPAPGLPRGVVGGLEWAPDNRRLAITLSTPNSAGDVYSFDAASGKLDRWTFSELGGLDPAALVEPGLIRYRSFDGRQIPAFIYKPRAGGGRRPVIISIHGGPEGQSRPGFSSTVQYWVNELGAAVVVPNVRGSEGYGKTYLKLDNAEKREDSVKDIGALLDWIATQPDLDPSRVVVHGGSYGGYMVLASMVNYNDRLAGGVDIVGISNWTTFLTNTEGYRRDLRRAEYGDERDPKMRAVFDRISPLNNIARVSKPMLVIQGANDPRVPKTEADQVVARIRGNGGDVWYLLARDEGHGFRKKQNTDVQREVETLFFRKVFGSAPAQTAAR